MSSSCGQMSNDRREKKIIKHLSNLKLVIISSIVFSEDWRIFLKLTLNSVYKRIRIIAGQSLKGDFFNPGHRRTRPLVLKTTSCGSVHFRVV